ncbi:MAG: rhomboid family intramembrane serine protease [Gemmataceae bacterium]
MILRDCAYTGEESWYLAEYSKQTGVDRDHLEFAADQLRRAGVIELTKFVPGRGQGFAITGFGIEMLRSSKYMGRLRTMGVAGLPVPKPSRTPAGAGGYPGRDRPDRGPEPRDRSGVKDMPEGVREVAPKEAHEFAPTVAKEFQGKGDGGAGSQNKVLAVLSANKAPILTIGLVMLGVLNYLYGMRVAMDKPHELTMREYLGGMIDPAIYYQLGAMSRNLVVDSGEWFRLLTSAFVFQGFIHVAFNMMALFSSGRQMEKIWGGWRFIILFVLCILGSSCAKLLTVTPETVNYPQMGAFGAVCGFLGSTLMWAIIARSSLPSDVFWGLIRSVTFSALFIGILCFIWPYGLWGYIIGALTGCVITVPLYFTRFSSGILAPTLGFVAIGLIALFGLGFTWYTFGARDVGTQVVVTMNEVQVFNKDLEDDYLSRLVVELPFTKKEAKTWHKKIDNILKKIQKSREQLERYRIDVVNGKERLKLWEDYLQTARGLVKEDGKFDFTGWERLNEIRREIRKVRQRSDKK